MGQLRSSSLRQVLADDRVIASSLTLVAFILYVRTLAPGILDGDSGEWQYMANILGVAHSTGYPLYLLLAKLFTLLPLGTPAWRVNLFSAACAAISLPFVYWIGRRVSGSRAAALVATSLFALAPTLWASAVEAEVYALNTLLLTLTLHFAVRWHDGHKPMDLFALAFAFGLALDNHRVALFVAPALLLLLLLNRRWLSARRIVVAATLVIVPLLLYLYIPIRAGQLVQEQSAANWDLYPRSEAMLKGTISAYYNNTPYGVINLITGFDNRNKLGFQDDSTDSLYARSANGVMLLFEQFNPLVVLLALVGIVILLRHDQVLGLAFIAWSVGISAISIELHAQSTRFYFSGAYMILALCFGIAAAAVMRWSRSRSWFRLAVPSLLAVLPFISLWTNFSIMDESQFTDYDVYARSTIRDNLAPNAVVVAPWEIATGLRYLQFVEGQRTDLLVIHESPVRPQFNKLLASARSLRRPFYYVQFNPEERTTAGIRTVQAIGLPLLSKPSPRYTVNSNLTDSVRFLGYDLDPDPIMPGKTTRVMVYYEVTASISTQFVAGLNLTDIKGDPHGEWEHPPVTTYYPTYYWKPGEFYRDVWDIQLPADSPKGLYSLELSWFPFDPTTNATHYELARTVPFGPIRAGDFGAGQPPTPLTQEFANGMRLLGFGVGTPGSPGRSAEANGDALTQLQRGQPLTVSLYWAASRPIHGAYTVFVHLEDSAGQVRAQSDRPPWDGLFPTDRWPVGETVRDDYTFGIPGNLAAGEYSLRVGVYQTPDKRVPLVSADDQLLLASFHVTER